MRFLCVQCDEALTFVESKGPDEGSLTAFFGCPSCGRQIAMITNPQETQIVRSLPVQIGGRTLPPEPLEALRGSPAHRPLLAPETPSRVSGASAGADAPWAGPTPLGGSLIGFQVSAGISPRTTASSR